MLWWGMCPWSEDVLVQGKGSSWGEQGWRSWRGGEEAGLGEEYRGQSRKLRAG